MENSGIMNLSRDQCGSEPARECGVSVNIVGDCYNAFASRLAPTGIRAEPRKMAVILKQNGDHWPPFSASMRI
ncbi:hypothetical protein C1893_05870 [Pseudomonas sp. MPR-ANC1]|nr:hypothetical protein C1893_05870 [Pseudomonas sp. MPR-ANC1]